MCVGLNKKSEGRCSSFLKPYVKTNNKKFKNFISFYLNFEFIKGIFGFRLVKKHLTLNQSYKNSAIIGH